MPGTIAMNGQITYSVSCDGAAFHSPKFTIRDDSEGSNAMGTVFARLHG